MISLGKKALKSTTLGLIGGISLALTLAGVNEVWVLFGAGALGVSIHLLTRPNSSFNTFIAPLGTLLVAMNSTDSNWKIFWIFLKVGSILYGSGYVLFAFLDAELVAKGLLTKQELILQFKPHLPSWVFEF